MLLLNGVARMQEYVSIANVSDSVIRAESSFGAPKTLARRRALPASDDDALESWRGSMNAEVALDWLRAAVAEIFKAVNNGLQNERKSAKRCMQRVVTILRVDPWLANAMAAFDFPREECSKPIRGGLASWQKHRVTTHIEANLETAIKVKDLAALINLSSCYFSRVFKESFDETPHGYVTHRRVERAKGLMLTTDASLVRIAADCGLSDQAHLNKIFRRFVGESPGAWRRARAPAPVYRQPPES
jgi:AraC family transcriptional regulator